MCKQIENIFPDNFFESILTSICATIVFLSIYEFIWKNLVSFCKNKKYVGRYYHYKKDKSKSITNGKHHYSDIKIKFFKRNVLFVTSHDFAHPCKIWKGEIKIDSSKFMNGIGTYSYIDKSSMGNHRVYSSDGKTIFVQVLDYRGIGDPNLWIKD